MHGHNANFGNQSINNSLLQTKDEGKSATGRRVTTKQPTPSGEKQSIAGGSGSTTVQQQF